MIGKRNAQVQEGWLTLVASNGDEQRVALDSDAWYAWLAGVRSFAYRGPNGSFTAQKERRQRGGDYWYAYRKQNGRLRRLYIGRDAHLTSARMAAVAQQLASLNPDAPRSPSRSSGETNGPLVDANMSAHVGLNGVSSDELLGSKLVPPVASVRIVARSRLIERIDEAVQQRLTLLVAPPGYGKTTLLGTWVQRTSIPVAWVTLEGADNDPLRYWSSLFQAWARLQPDHPMRTALAMLYAAQPVPVQSALTAWLNSVRNAPQNAVLVLDDYQLITEPTIHEAMAFFVEHLPPNLHLIVSSRSEPPWSLPRLRARGELETVGPNELGFTADEAALFLTQTMGLRLAASDVANAARRTEGWVAGLQLVALSLRDHPDLPSLLADLGGDHRYISDYLISEVLDQQPPEVQDFLLQTSILQRLAEGLCDAVTEQPRGRDMLERLERSNLFLTPLDHTRTWYRYHQLFAEALVARLRRSRPELVPVLHRRASSWFAAQGSMPESIAYALEGHLWPEAMDLIESVCTMMTARGEQASLQRWLEALPPSMLETRPSLCLWYAWTLLFNRHITACERPLAVAESAWRMTGNGQLLGEIHNLRSAIAYFGGEMTDAVQHARNALRHLPEEARFQRAVGALYLYHGSMHLGKVADAARALDEARALITPGPAPDAALQVSSIPHDVQLAEAALHVRMGELHEAARLYQAILRSTDNRLRSLLAAHMGLSRVLCAWNDLEAAEDHARRGVVLCQNIGETLSLPDAYATLALVQRACGQADDALRTLREAVRCAEEVGRRTSVYALRAAEAAVWLAQGRVAEAIKWAQTCELAPEHVPPYDRLDEYLTLARIHIVRGGTTVVPVLQRLLHAATVDGRGQDVLEILVLLALSYQRSGLSERAVAMVERALVLAQPHGYVRLFINEGAPMAALLGRAAAHSSVPDEIHSLLGAFGAAPHPGNASRATEMLSAREHEVLRFIATGASNLEIATKLGLSLHTIKKHVSNVYGKLGVRSRTQAIATAQQRSLL